MSPLSHTINPGSLGRYYFNVIVFILLKVCDHLFVDMSTTIPAETRIIIYPLNVTPASAFKTKVKF